MKLINTSTLFSFDRCLRTCKSNFTYPFVFHGFTKISMFCFIKALLYGQKIMLASINFTTVINLTTVTKNLPDLEIKTGKCILPLRTITNECSELSGSQHSSYRIYISTSYQFWRFVRINKFTGVTNV